MRRSFWIALGLGAGATGAVVTSRWARRQARKVAPTTLAREAKGGLLDLGKLVSESIAQGRLAMADRERELRAEVLGEHDPAATAPPDAGSARPPAA
ncbi:MAG: hypothetical protein H0W82_08785 [Actinobacteria bacterium]|nr:hypothetical protein [Actinomycetota bacterium]